MGIVPKMIVVVFGSFVLTMVVYEAVIRRVKPFRVAFGMKPKIGVSSAER
jgi:hypothetical protein